MSFLVAVFYSLVCWRLFYFLSKPELLQTFSEFRAQKKSMQVLAGIFITCYFARSTLFLMMGHYSKIVNSVFWRYELYFIISTLFEVPNLCMTYITNYSDFKGSEVSYKSDAASHGSINNKLDDSADQFAYDSEKQERSMGKTGGIIVVVATFEIDYVQEYRKRVQSIDNVFFSTAQSQALLETVGDDDEMSSGDLKLSLQH